MPIIKGKEKLENRPLLALMVGYFLISQPILMVPRVKFYVILAPDSIFGLKSDLRLVKVGEKQLFWSFLSFLLKKKLGNLTFSATLSHSLGLLMPNSDPTANFTIRKCIRVDLLNEL